MVPATLLLADPSNTSSSNLASGCPPKRQRFKRVYTERASGARDDRPELARILRNVLRAGDTLVVWKLDRLARSLKTLIATAEALERQGVGLLSLTESIDTTTPGGMLSFTCSGPSRSSSVP